LAGGSAGGGGGGGGGASTGVGFVGGIGGLYGGGAGGGGNGAIGGAGGQGLIVITYTPLDFSFSVFDPPAPPKAWPLNALNRNAQQRDFQEFINAPGNPNQVFGRGHDWWPRAPGPINRAKDWIAYSGAVIVGVPPYLTPFTPFDPGRHGPNNAKDWVAFSGNFVVETFPPHVGFLEFALGRPAPNRAVDFIAYSGNEFVEAFPQIGIDFLTFSPGRTAKLWGTGQPPPWWPYYFQAKFFPKRDRHDGDWIPKHRHPPVYSDEYYERLRRREEREEDAPPQRKPRNLLIPLKGLIAPVSLPSLLLSPPPPFVHSLTSNPPPFRMATPEEIAADDEAIIAMLLRDE
jgi:hypothetical protein